MNGRWTSAAALVAAVVAAAAVTALVVAVTLWGQQCWGPKESCQSQYDQPLERR